MKNKKRSDFMAFLRFLTIVFLFVILLKILRPQRPEIAVLLAIAISLCLFGYLLNYLGELFGFLEQAVIQSKIDSKYFYIVMKMLGVAYLGGIGAQICRDANEGGLSEKIELAGKIVILGLGLPIMLNLLETLSVVFTS